ncbi:DUF1206 domain-containing protein [Phaeobacter gallaeciensis]|uniref:DUF1206 domain-containing protein n=1 Tax=Phaeobacter gallaeciensis TaxID=60890 RepID=A0AAD0EBJ5_9RHOB|nr:DUF1206 domain-containing protein [Phaeobacter gallaeciensis]AHD08159.1 Domain protein of Unknown Function [Phaeobacter gallaeciensis DSM 26640]ATE91425.1 Domain protein of Unknown Function [Phaeobacter gallaeciensis]ATE95701.1 Domain protein of Unknown Function [Phaeobacter gallaeciensis]ATF00041.1 Domain protein of Unknown Function [Phaeobacter gallaeciensis]ATF04473.1 Domain protein of Unknown Function [Phaeobacter gallaeciensis]
MSDRLKSELANRTLPSQQTRNEILDQINPDDFSWAIPIMRTGYGGRALVYLTIAGTSLWSIWQGGDAKGTTAALEWLDGGWGTIVLLFIILGLTAYAIWRVVDSIWDLEAYGLGVKGLVARTAMIVTGLVHLVMAGLAVAVLIDHQSDSNSRGDKIAQLASSSTGTIIFSVVGLLTLSAAVYYLHKAWDEGYRTHLKANQLTRRLNTLLKIGVAANGVVIGVIGALIMKAAVSASADNPDGIGSVFDWLQAQVFGQILVTALCLGLLGFALFCWINALYRVVPKASSSGTKTLGDVLSGD